MQYRAGDTPTDEEESRSLDHESERAELLKLLVAAIRSRPERLTESEAGIVANLWMRKRDLLTRDVEGQSFAGVELARDLNDRRRSVQELEHKLRAVHDDEERIVSAAGLAAHRGWREPFQRASSPDPRKDVMKAHPVCEARMVQWAVGQGGFWTTSGLHRSPHSGSERPFDFVFDCGSSTAGALARALREYRPAGTTINYLFLSHLDRDHTSGVEQLLASYRVHTVIMPLLSPAATLLASARLAARDGLSVVEMELLTNPAAYFRDRRVQRVILVQSAPEDGNPDAPRAPLPTQTSNSRGPDAAGSPRELILPGSRGAHVTSPFPDTEAVPHATTFWLLGDDGRGFWQLAPYVHPFEPLRVGRFMQSAYKLLDAAGGSAPGGSRYAALKSLVGSPSGRQDLKRLYKLVRSDHNSVSMSLFSCPCPSADGRAQLSVRVSRPNGPESVIQPSTSRFGWLHTGDSTLALASYRREWLAYFKDVLSHVAVLVAPHHGSRRHFHPDILSIPAPPLALACASRTNSYGHPAAVVARSARSSRAVYHQVDERPESVVTGLYVD